MKFSNALKIVLAAAWITTAIAGRSPAQQATPDGASSEGAQAVAETSTPPPKSALADLAWLAGRWQGTWGPRTAQQTWTAPNAGVMLGTFQLAEGDKTLVLELFTIVDRADGVKLYLRHFTESLAAWEKPGPTTLDLHSADARSIIFVNPVDGQPKQDTITRIDTDTYVLRSEIIPEKGDEQVTEITYHRVHDGSPPKRHGGKSKKPHQ